MTGATRQQRAEPTVVLYARLPLTTIEVLREYASSHGISVNMAATLAIRSLQILDKIDKVPPIEETHS